MVLMTDSPIFPQLRQVVLDAEDARQLAEFYRELLGLAYRPGDEPPPAGEPDPAGADWLVLRDPAGPTRIAFAQVDSLPPATWPEGPRPQQLHLDLTVPTAAELDRVHERTLASRSPAAVRPLRGSRGAPAGVRRPGRAPVLHIRGRPARLTRPERPSRALRRAAAAGSFPRQAPTA